MNDKLQKYRAYFTKDYLMGPNSMRLLNELTDLAPEGMRFGRTLDLGCGMGLSSLFLARETNAETVYAFDLWIDATDNYKRIEEQGLADRIIPIHGNALEMPFAHGYFDTVVSMDAFHYFGCEKGVFGERILPFVKEGGTVLISVPGLKEEPKGDMEVLFKQWATDGDDALFRTCAWWKNHLEEECGGTCDITVTESECFEEAWEDWFLSKHEYAQRDEEFLRKGLWDTLNFVCMRIQKK